MVRSNRLIANVLFSLVQIMLIYSVTWPGLLEPSVVRKWLEKELWLCRKQFNAEQIMTLLRHARRLGFFQSSEMIKSCKGLRPRVPFIAAELL